MNASERLQAVIQSRLKGEPFAWGPILMVWAATSALRMAAEVVTGPTLLGGAGALAVAVAFQTLWPRRPSAPATSRGWTLQGLWLLTAAAVWFLGSVAPVSGLLSPEAGAVLELLFLAGGLAQTGIMKSRPVLTWGALVLALSSVVLGALPILLSIRALLVVLAFGVPAYLAHRADARS